MSPPTISHSCHKRPRTCLQLEETQKEERKSLKIDKSQDSRVHKPSGEAEIGDAEEKLVLPRHGFLPKKSSFTLRKVGLDKHTMTRRMAERHQQQELPQEERQDSREQQPSGEAEIGDAQEKLFLPHHGFSPKKPSFTLRKVGKLEKHTLTRRMRHQQQELPQETMYNQHLAVLKTLKPGNLEFPKKIKSSGSEWTQEEDDRLLYSGNMDFFDVAEQLGRNYQSCKERYDSLKRKEK